jgi:hypothetical protein
MALGLFVYYRSARQDSAAVVAAAKAMQGAVRARWPLLQTEFLQRLEAPPTEDSPPTWMEVYRWPSRTLASSTEADPALPSVQALARARAELAALSLQCLVQGGCHLEWFNDPEPPAEPPFTPA